MLLSNSTDESFIQVANGQLPLVIEVSKADHIASLILLKRNLEQINGNSMKWIFSGCQEAYLVASGLAEAEIGVILNPPRAFPGSWDTRRASPGPPWVEKTAPSILFSAGVKLAIGVPEEWQTRQVSALFSYSLSQTGANTSNSYVGKLLGCQRIVEE